MKTVAKIGIVMIATVVIFFLAIVIFAPPLPRPGLVFEASREASIGGIWLGLYDDKRFAIGNSRGDVNCEGYYVFKSDTLILRVAKGVINKSNPRVISFLLKDDLLVESPKVSGIGFLEIGENHIKNKSN